MLFRNTCISKTTGEVKGRREWTRYLVTNVSIHRKGIETLTV